MMNIYLISGGDWDSYHVFGVYSDKSVAEAALAIANKHNHNAYGLEEITPETEPPIVLYRATTRYNWSTGGVTVLGDKNGFVVSARKKDEYWTSLDTEGDRITRGTAYGPTIEDAVKTLEEAVASWAANRK